MQSAEQAPQTHRCKAQNKRGEPCEATIIGRSGFCNAHDPQRKVDMRELGRAGGRARRRGIGERLPASKRDSLRGALRELDHGIVKNAIERALAGGNESARVSAVKLLADLEPFGKGECEVCKEREANAPDIEARLLELLARSEPERKAKVRAAVHEELAVLAEYGDTAQVEARLLARL